MRTVHHHAYIEGRLPVGTEHCLGHGVHFVLTLGFATASRKFRHRTSTAGAVVRVMASGAGDVEDMK